jgi:ribosomal peptide maturation radical SAM protein 1
MGAHILQACCKQAGFSIQIFYANILFASHIREEYEILCNINYSLNGERIFARAAFGNQDHEMIHENVYNNSHIFGTQKASKIHNSIYFYPPIQQIGISRLRQIEEKAYEWIEEISGLLTQMPYKIMGCSSNYEQINSSIAFLKRAKENNPDITTLIGGFNCEGEYSNGIGSLDPEQKIIDYIFSGESENTLVDFLLNFKKGIKEKNRIIFGKPCTDLDSLPEVDYNQYFEQLYSFIPSYAINPQRINMCYETSRGCWWGEKNQCLFCGCNGERLTFRQKSPTRVIHSLMKIKKYNINYLQMTDLIMPDDYFTNLLPELEKEKHPFKIYYEQKANLGYDKLKQLKNAGITEIQPGIETLSNTLLQQINKGTTSWKNIKLLRDSLTLQVNVYWNFIWGFPNEKTQDYIDMSRYMPLLLHLQPPIGVFHLSLTRFSPYFSNSIRYGIKNLKPINSYQEIFPPHADIEKIAGFFVGDYETETYEEPAIISEFINVIQEWNERWQTAESKPVLQLSQQSENEYALTDTRNLVDTRLSYIIDKNRASVLLKDGKYTSNEDQEWALSNKLALVMEGHFVSLVTTTPDLKEELNE